MNINLSYYTATGCRDQNEDAVSILEGSGGLLAVVADGLGGQARGEIASRQAVESINRLLHNRIPQQALLADAIAQASNDIYSQQQPGSSMGTTIAVVWLGARCFAATAGDTRIYQFRDGRILFQSRDHTVAQLAVLAGELSPDAIRTSSDRNKLIRVLGQDEPPKAEIHPLQVLPGDRFLICSDGFWGPVTEEAMLETAQATQNAQQWLEQMQTIVLRSQDPRQDNHTAIALILHP